MFWTELHVYTLIPQFVVYIVLAFVLSRLLKNKSFEVQMLPLKICTVILLVLEVAKQIVNIVEGYDLYAIPLHFCSLFLYFHPLACFTKGKIREKFLVIAGVVSTCLFLFMAIYPNLIYGDAAIVSMWNFITGQGGGFSELHTVVFHGIALFTFFLFAFQGLAKFDIKKDLILVAITYAIYCIVVGPLAQIINTNFNNFVHSNAPFLEDLRLAIRGSLGDVLGQTIYVLIISVGTIIVPLIAYFVLMGIVKGFDKLFNKGEKEIEEKPAQQE